MDGQSQSDAKLQTVRSVSLEEILQGRRGLLARFLALAKAALMVCGAISLSAAMGIGAYYLQGGADAPLLVSKVERTVEPAAEEAAAAAAPIHTGSLAAAGAAEVAADAAANGAEQDAAGLGLPSPILDVPPPAEEELAAARLPRPRPLEPVIVGGIYRPAVDPFDARFLGPCEALNRLGGFRVRCFRESRFVPPPSYRHYAPPR